MIKHIFTNACTHAPISRPHPATTYTHIHAQTQTYTYIHAFTYMYRYIREFQALTQDEVNFISFFSIRNKK